MNPRRGMLAPWLDDGGPIHVVGASGAEGVALLRFLVGDLGIEGVVAHDFSDDDRAFAASFRRANTAWERREREQILKDLRRLPVEWRLGAEYVSGLQDAALIFASQNWFNYPANLPALPDAMEAGVPLRGVVDLAMDLFQGTRVGVTGSNGKSTTSGLLAALLRGAWTGGRLLHGGNDRDAQASLSDVEAASPTDVLVWEVSNRHLRDRRVPVDVGVLTNITRNHIEDHGSWEAYVEAKSRLVVGARHAVITGDDPVSMSLLPAIRSAGTTPWITSTAGAPPEVPGEGAVWLEGDLVMARTPVGEPEQIGDASTLRLPGLHNRRNLLSAVAGALAAGAAPETFARSWGDFAPLTGRLELVAEQDEVRWIYDIQATTAPASEAGVRAVGARQPVVLLVGGEDKGMDYSGMADATAAVGRAVIALPGSGTDAFLEALAGRVPVVRVDDLDAALPAAREQAQAGDAVLLSPGCAFFHSTFITGGASFARRVRSLLDDA